MELLKVGLVVFIYQAQRRERSQPIHPDKVNNLKLETNRVSNGKFRIVIMGHQLVFKQSNLKVIIWVELIRRW